ncbi:MAG TPA: hypothetical protein PK990_10085 [Salinivirgaceae bacterium]|nr:hypothetical protein [Salinivirgaceae bacterium]
MSPRRNVLKIKDYDENDDILIGIITDFPHYKVAFHISVLLDIQLVHNQYVSDAQRLTFSDFPSQFQPLNKIDLEFYRFSFGEKNREILLVPNQQEYLIPQKSDSDKKDLLFEDTAEVKHLYLLPNVRHLNYLLRFSNYDNIEILDFCQILFKSKLFRAIVPTQTKKVKNAATLYLL